VDNTSDATKDAATATLTNKTLTSPVITTPTGLVKGDVGLGNVDNTSDAAKPVSTSGQTALDLKLDDSQASAFGLSLLDDADATAGRGTLGLGTLATQDGIFSGTSSGLNTGNQTLVGLGGVAAAGGTITSGTLALTTINTGTISGGTLTPVTVTASGNVTATGDVDATNVYAENNVNATNNVNTTNVNATNVTATGSFNGNGSALTDMTKSQVGLSNVDNTSDATKDAATATLTNKTLTSPVITTPTGLVKGDVGLGNVDNTSDAAKPVSTSGQTALDLKLDDSQASAFGLSLLDDADATAGRGTLGLGTLATQDGIFSGTSSGLNTGNQTLVGLGGVAAAGGTITSGTLALTTINTGTISGGAFIGDGSGLTGMIWSQIGSTPTTLSGYGITDALPLAGGTVTGSVLVDGNTTLGDASGDSVTINAGTVTAANATDVSSNRFANVGALDDRYDYMAGNRYLEIDLHNFTTAMLTAIGGTASSSVSTGSGDTPSWTYRPLNTTDGAANYQALRGPYSNLSVSPKSRSIKNWSKATVLSVRFQHPAASAGTSRYYLGPQASTWAGGSLAVKGIGFEIVANSLFAVCHDGTTKTTAGSGVAITTSTQNIIVIASDGAGGVRWWVNGAEQTALSGGPTGDSASSQYGFCTEAVNPTPATATFISIQHINIKSAL